MNKSTYRILIVLAVIVFAIGIFLIMKKPDGDGLLYSPVLPIGAVITLIIILAARRKRLRRERENNSR